MLSGDTDRKSALRQIDTLRRPGIRGRAEMTFQLSNNLRSIVEAGIRQRHPDYSQEEVTRAVLSLVLDRDLFLQVFPNSEIYA